MPVVSGAATPTFYGSLGVLSAATGILATAPRLSGFLAGQTDLPSSFTDGPLSNSGNYIYAEILP